MTPRQRLASLLLGRPVLEYIQDLHNTGMSYDRIAAQLSDDTDGQVDISHEAIRQWLPEQAKPKKVTCPTCGRTYYTKKGAR